MAVDNDRLMEFLGRFVGDLGATVAAGNIVVGHRLGLYQALARGPAAPEELAERAGCAPRYITEWLRGQAAGGYVEYDPADAVSTPSPKSRRSRSPTRTARFTCPPRSSSRSARCAPNRRSPRRSAAARAWAGTSTTTTSSSAASGSSGPATSPTS